MSKLLEIKSIFLKFKIKVKNFIFNKQLLVKILYTLLLLFIFRIAATITVPGIKSFDASSTNDSSSFLSLMDMMGGGSIKRFSIVALGISPFITVSILMTILQSEFFPPIYRLAHSGANGRKKINVITRLLTLIFGIFQAITISKSFETSGLMILHKSFNKSWFINFGIPLILLAGSMFTLFLGEQITSKGIGNGTSLIIFSGIAVSLPAKFKFAYQHYIDSTSSTSVFVGVINFIVYIFLFLFMIFIIGYIYKSERHIPLQQTGKGLTTNKKQMSRLPIKINSAGVMPIMFASLIIIIPLQISQLLSRANLSRIWIEKNLKFTDPVGLIVYIVVIFLFTLVMSILMLQPNKISENFSKNGIFIPGIRPGTDTEEYLTKVLIRLSIFSAFFLSIIAATQYIEQMLGMNPAMTIGGTSMIILVSVSIETYTQVITRKKAKQFVDLKKNKNNNASSSLW